MQDEVGKYHSRSDVFSIALVLTCHDLHERDYLP